MKKGTIWFVFSWLLLSAASAQETKEVTKQDNAFSEKYTVLKTNKSIKHGSYQRYYREKLIEKGEYQDDKRVGVWEFNDLSGKLDQTFNYSTQQVLYSSNYNKPDSLQILYAVISGRDSLYTPLAPPPVPVGGAGQFARIMITNLRYPVSAIKGNKQGTTMMTFTITETGEFVSPTIIKSSGDRDMDAEALRVINLYRQLEWIPAELNGRKVGVIMIQPIRFNNIGIVNR